MATWGKTTFTEFIGTNRGPDEQFMAEGARVIRQLDVIPGTVTARQQAVADFLGYQKVQSHSITRGTPIPYTFAQSQPSLLPNAQYLYAANIVRGEGISPTGTTVTNATGGPVGQAAGVAVGGNFARYRYTIEFTTRAYDIRPDSSVLAVKGGGILPGPGQFPDSPIQGSPDEGQMLSGPAFSGFQQLAASPPTFSTRSRYVTRYFRPSGRVRVLPYGLLKWFSDNNPIREGMPYSETTGSLQYVWALVPEAGVPLKAIQSTLNCINQYWFDGFYPETLLFKSMNLKRFIGPLGDALYNIEYIFSWLPNRLRSAAFVVGLPKDLPVGWNYQLRTKDVAGTAVLDYDLIVDDKNNATSQSPYQRADFASLFRPD